MKSDVKLTEGTMTETRNLRRKVELQLRELEQYGNFGTLLIGGAYYWVVPKMVLTEDVAKAKQKAMEWHEQFIDKDTES